MKTLTSKKNVEGNIQGFILSIVGVAVVLAVGLIVLGQLQVNTFTPTCPSPLTVQYANGVPLQCSNATVNASLGGLTTAYNSTGSIVTQLGTVPNWIGIIITVALAFIVLGYFYNRM